VTMTVFRVLFVSILIMHLLSGSSR
jgi:hypothetical protein